jgi:glycosyltransferase involved in cell wall biosynthesis
VRVLHVHSGNIYGGIETMLLTIARARRRHGDAELNVALCFEGRVADSLRASGAMVSILGAVRLSRPLTVRRGREALMALLGRVRPDLVVMHAPWTQAIFGGLVKRLGYPLVTWMHGPATGWLSRAAARHRPAAVLCNSAFTAASIPRAYQSIPRAVIYCPSAPPPQNARATRCTSRSEMGCGEADVVIAQVSRLERWKGHEVHLRALGRLREIPGWALWLVGGAQCPAEVGYENALRGLAAHLGIAGRVRFLGQRDDVPALLAAADIYCQPNTEPEPFGLSYVEALAAGLPVIASDLGGVREIITRETGILVQPGDSDQVAAALRRLIEDPSERGRLGGNGPARAAALCDPRRQIEAIAGFLGRVARSVA